MTGLNVNSLNVHEHEVIDSFIYKELPGNCVFRFEWFRFFFSDSLNRFFDVIAW